MGRKPKFTTRASRAFGRTERSFEHTFGKLLAVGVFLLILFLAAKANPVAWQDFLGKVGIHFAP